MGYPDEKTFVDLSFQLSAIGHNVIRINPPYFPDDLKKYSLSATLNYCRQEIESKYAKSDLVLIGSSMGSVIAIILATEFDVRKLILLVPPYQFGTDDDIAGKYSEWKNTGFREYPSSKYGKLTIPFSFVEDAQKYNSLDYIDRISAQLCIIAAEKDDKVGPKPAKLLFDKAKTTKEWHLIKGAEHKYQYQPDKLAEVNKIIIDFVEKS